MLLIRTFIDNETGRLCAASIEMESMPVVDFVDKTLTEEPKASLTLSRPLSPDQEFVMSIN